MPKTYNELFLDLRRRLKEAGVEACSLEARLLTAFAADKTPERLLADLQLYSSDEIEQKLEALALRRLSGEPAAYILGSWGFYGLDFLVTRDVLIPRSDTEVLAEKALSLLRGKTEEARVLDLCTGSGCIGCTIAHEMPKSRAVLVDNSAPALAVAKENAKRLGLGTRAVCMEIDVNATPQALLGSFDMIVSNPPYIRRGEIASLDVDVKDYEPHAALDGGEDGLDFYRVILNNWKALLRQSGWMLFEVGEDQAEDVKKLMLRAQLRNIGTEKDTAGFDRVVFGRL